MSLFLLYVILFVARSGTQTVLDFTPTPDFPSLQYFDVVERHSQADLAGLRAGDFLLQVGNLLSMSNTIGCIFCRDILSAPPAILS